MRPYVQLTLVTTGIVVALCVGMFLGGNPKYLPQEFRDIFVEDSRAIHNHQTVGFREGRLCPMTGPVGGWNRPAGSIIASDAERRAGVSDAKDRFRPIGDLWSFSGAVS